MRNFDHLHLLPVDPEYFIALSIFCGGVRLNCKHFEEFPPSTCASSASTMPVKDFPRYDVFINHFEHPLGGAIYKELHALGLNVFLNSEEPELGEEVEAAFTSAWLYIPIFSEGYAQSNRCLEEVTFMHNKGKGTKIFPIFCRVNPDDVRYVKGPCAFDPNKVGCNSEKLEEWRRALYSVSHYVGPVVKSKEDENMLLKTITEWVAKEVKKCQDLVASAKTSSSIQLQGEGFAATTSSSGGSIMLVRKLDYDVFINHRGPDVKRTLATAIYKMLTGMGLKVFLDSEELTWGVHFPSVLEEVIKSTWLNIAIFSEDYASSKWCLKELLLFRRREGSIFVPIFYHVWRNDIIFGEGRYGEAFARHQHKGRHNPEKLEEWKEALWNASNYVGHIVNSKYDEKMLMKKMEDLVTKEGKEAREFKLGNTRSVIHPRGKLAFLSGGIYARPMRDVRYDVHINHPGPDVKPSLVLPIYNKLKDMGLKVFLDTEELRLGDHISSVTEEAISSARIHIVIFSKRYAESPWCLSELRLMLETDAIIVPIFYYIEPGDVRCAKESYARAIDRHVEKQKYTLDKILEWEEALYCVSCYVGHIVESKEDEDKLLERIAHRVEREVGMTRREVERRREDEMRRIECICRRERIIRRAVEMTRRERMK